MAARIVASMTQSNNFVLLTLRAGSVLVSTVCLMLVLMSTCEHSLHKWAPSLAPYLVQGGIYGGGGGGPETDGGDFGDGMPHSPKHSKMMILQAIQGFKRDVSAVVGLQAFSVFTFTNWALFGFLFVLAIATSLLDAGWELCNKRLADIVGTDLKTLEASNPSKERALQ